MTYCLMLYEKYKTCMMLYNNDDMKHVVWNKLRHVWCNIKMTIFWMGYQNDNMYQTYVSIKWYQTGDMFDVISKWRYIGSDIKMITCI